MAWVLAILVLLHGLGVRRKLSQLPVAADGTGVPTGRVVLAQGDVQAETVARVAAYAGPRGLDAVELVPGGLGMGAALRLGMTLGPEVTGLLGNGTSAGTGIWLSDSLYERLGRPTSGGVIEQVYLSKRAKRHAPWGFGVLVVPELQPPTTSDRDDLEAAVALTGVPPLLVGHFIGLILWGWAVYLLISGPTLSAAVLVAVLFAVPALATVGTSVRPVGHLASLLQPLRDVRWAFWLVFRAESPQVVSARPRATERALALSSAREAPRTTCPLCGGSPHTLLRLKDTVANKPGEFVVDRCADCGLRFQNPQVTGPALGFFYEDVYDGIGAETADAVFRSNGPQYRRRAELLQQAHPTAVRWLDVGAGYGHQALVAREMLPDMRFAALDFGQSVEEGLQRGWLDEAYRGELVALAPSLEGRFDVVSMFHYLEHTWDPSAELAAAAQVLAPGGLLMVEVPDPECLPARLLGRWWSQWVQPQHLFLLTEANLVEQMTLAGLQVQEVQRARAASVGDFTLGAGMLIQRMAGPGSIPWRPPMTHARQVRRALVWAALWPVVLVGVVLDVVMLPWQQRGHFSNAFCVLAAKPPQA